jgi:hypothetical protein
VDLESLQRKSEMTTVAKIFFISKYFENDKDSKRSDGVGSADRRTTGSS